MRTPARRLDCSIVSNDVFGIVGSTQAGMFRVDRVIAEGGFGVVYQAYHIAFRSPVALKCLKLPTSMTTTEREMFLEKFREEGELLFRLSSLSPAVVRPLHVDALTLENGQFVPFLALEWLEGDPLVTVIRRRRAQGKPPIDIRTLVPFFQPVAHALAQAHSCMTPEGKIAIIHRDIKPENIFVMRRNGAESVRILDFGIARAKSAASLHAGRSTHGNVFDAFTPGYAAPEQWSPKRFGQTGPWTDVWGFALSMVEVLTGKPPIDAEDATGMMGMAVDEKRRPTPRAEGANVPDGVEEAFRRALEVDPRQRTQSIERFWTELEQALELPLSFPATARKPALLSMTVDASTLPAPRSGALAETMPAPVPSGQSTRAAPQAAKPEASIRQPAVARTKESPVLPVDLAVRRPVTRQRNTPVDMQLAGPRPRVRGDAAPRSSIYWPDVWRRLRQSMEILALAGLIAVADLVYTRMTGTPFQVGGIRPAVISGFLGAIAVILACFRLVFGG